MSYCGKCGKEVEPGELFCGYCGAPQAGQTMQSVQSVQSLQAVKRAKKKSKAPLIVSLCAGVVLVALVALFFLLDPFKLFGPKEPHSPMEVAQMFCDGMNARDDEALRSLMPEWMLKGIATDAMFSFFDEAKQHQMQLTFSVAGTMEEMGNVEYEDQAVCLAANIEEAWKVDILLTYEGEPGSANAQKQLVENMQITAARIDGKWYFCGGGGRAVTLEDRLYDIRQYGYATEQELLESFIGWINGSESTATIFAHGYADAEVAYWLYDDWNCASIAEAFELLGGLQRQSDLDRSFVAEKREESTWNEMSALGREWDRLHVYGPIPETVNWEYVWHGGNGVDSYRVPVSATDGTVAVGLYYIEYMGRYYWAVPHNTM